MACGVFFCLFFVEFIITNTIHYDKELVSFDYCANSNVEGNKCRCSMPMEHLQKSDRINVQRKREEELFPFAGIGYIHYIYT